MDDNRIVELYLLRDETAIKQTTEKYGSRLRSLACGIVNDQQTAEECENDTYMEAWNTIPPHEPRSYLYAFLARITRHISLNCCRDRNRLKRSAFICELSAELEQCIPAPDDVECRIDDIALSDVINRFLSKLDKVSRRWSAKALKTPRTTILLLTITLLHLAEPLPTMETAVSLRLK